MESPPTIFVSYGSEDAHLVDGLSRIMRLSGSHVFVDKQSIEPGEKWEEALRRAISAAQKFVLLWCCHSKESEWVDQEIQQAVNEGKPIIPLLLCPASVPEPVSQYQWIDLQSLVEHGCDHPPGRVNVSRHDGRLLLPGKPVMGATIYDTHASPHEYLTGILSQNASTSKMLNEMSSPSLAVSAAVLRELELQEGQGGSLTMGAT